MNYSHCQNVFEISQVSIYHEHTVRIHLSLSVLILNRTPVFGTWNKRVQLDRKV